MHLPDPPAVPIESPWAVDFYGGFRISGAATEPPDEDLKKREIKDRLAEAVERLSKQQEVLFAQDRYAVLLVFQAMDAAGKDSTIRAVMSGVNPAGCQVHAFKQPSSEELDHDFLWRTSTRLPERGRIGVFNRSYYEEVLVVRVHPEILDHQQLPSRDRSSIWAERLHSIREHEAHLARNGTIILKFWLNVSQDEQRRRFLSRLTDPEKAWKFEAGDLRDRARWKDYMAAYEEALNESSRPWAPWFAIPADDKPYMRMVVAETVASALEGLKVRFPEVPEDERGRFEAMRKELEG